MTLWVGFCSVKDGLTGKPGTQPRTPHSLLAAPRRPDSDAESREGLHQGDLGARVRVAPAAVPVAPALQGFVPVPLLLSFLLLYSLLFSPLFVCDLRKETAV